MVKNMKKIMITALIMWIALIQMGSVVQANSNNKRSIDSNEIFEDIYNESVNKSVVLIDSDYDAYAVLLKNIQYVKIKTGKQIDVDINKIVDTNTFNTTDIQTLNNFIDRVNILIQCQAITVDSDLKISFVSHDKNILANIRIDSTTINIMPEARKHVKELKKVHDNEIFNKYEIAAMYFFDKVKYGGEWDYKVKLGTKTTYYDEGLRNRMTGETIGNFHYGYVGSLLFLPKTLKTSAGVAQVLKGHSHLEWWNSYFDDPKDTKNIQWGIDVYKSEH